MGMLIVTFKLRIVRYVKLLYRKFVKLYYPIVVQICEYTVYCALTNLLDEYTVKISPSPREIFAVSG